MSHRASTRNEIEEERQCFQDRWSLCIICRVILTNISAGQSRHERIKRAVKCTVVFFAILLFFNSYVIIGKVEEPWIKNPIGTAVWLVLSLLLALWMAMWTSQCSVLMDPESSDMHIDNLRRGWNSSYGNSSSRVFPLTSSMMDQREYNNILQQEQRNTALVLSSLKLNILDKCPIMSYGSTLSTRFGRRISSKTLSLENNVCSICLIEFERETKIRETHCHHIFCSDCFEVYVNMCRTEAALTCPLCRSALFKVNPTTATLFGAHRTSTPTGLEEGMSLNGGSRISSRASSRSSVSSIGNGSLMMADIGGGGGGGGSLLTSLRRSSGDDMFWRIISYNSQEHDFPSMPSPGRSLAVDSLTQSSLDTGSVDIVSPTSAGITSLPNIISPQMQPPGWAQWTDRLEALEEAEAHVRDSQESM